MMLRALLPADAVLIDLRVGDKPHLLAELSRFAVARLGPDALGRGGRAAAVETALSVREKLGSTGLGAGFALPHARIAGLPALFGLFARLLRPIDYGAIDGQPVDLVFMLLIPEGAGNDHVAALAAIAREMRNADKRADLRRLRSAPELRERLLAGSD